MTGHCVIKCDYIFIHNDGAEEMAGYISMVTQKSSEWGHHDVLRNQIL